MAIQDRPYPTISESDLSFLAKRNIRPEDIQAIADLEPPQARQEVIILVASGMEPQTAIDYAMYPENPEKRQARP